ncbi:hypothetical protein NQZ68_003345, partial [Dissostichus eleginoides]
MVKISGLVLSIVNVHAALPSRGAILTVGVAASSSIILALTILEGFSTRYIRTGKRAPDWRTDHAAALSRRERKERGTPEDAEVVAGLPIPKAEACYGLRFAPCCSPAQYTTLVGSPIFLRGSLQTHCTEYSTDLVPPTVINCRNLNFHSWVLHPTSSPTPTLSPSPEKMSVSLITDIQQEGESGPLIEPCSRGKTSPLPQGTKEGTGEGLEPEDSSPQDAQKRAPNHSHGRKRAKSNAKLKLVRSLAVCEESSGPFSTDGPPES